MGRNERHTMQVRRATAAYNAAVRRLIAAHEAEFVKIHAEEAARHGVTPERHPKLRIGGRRRELEKLRQEILASGVIDASEVPKPKLPMDRYVIPENPVVAAQRMTRAEQLDAYSSRSVPAMPEYSSEEKPDIPVVPPAPF